MANHSGSDPWTGGWVRWADTLELVYVTAKQNVERNNSDGALGGEQNPFSHEAYSEMYTKKTWPGGFVSMVSNEDPVYIDRNDGEDSACGSGSGSGSGGANLSAGSMVVRPDSFSTDEYLTISWGDGSFDTGQNPSLSVEYHFPGGVSSDIVYQWDGSFSIRITFIRGSLLEYYYYSIPGEYRS